MRPVAVIPALMVAGAVSGCEAEKQGQAGFEPEYYRVETELLDTDLVNLHVAMRSARGRDDVMRFAECAAAQYTMIRGYGFARHVRTNITDQAGIWHADAVYTISRDLPRGLETIDAKVVAAECAENGIPMV